AIQFFAPGIPQVYYVGLLAGVNQDERVKETGDGREINRENFSIEDVEKHLEKEVVQRLLDLIRFRNEYPAFDGTFTVLPSSSEKVALRWDKDEYYCELHVDLLTGQSTIQYVDELGEQAVYAI
ncbi:MAG: sucrose phosphorylase, partial [Bacillota bacterium]